ncbi:hypothetical protein IM793_03770 [Pedobacter sp. MR2016-19]|uniref:hypothetical protein n=1 Tax=Pedobacter sp. MR2016-19 TaxID=2780089 RepID=UPI001873F0FC|nr:hypothetical protein [Pedobacter sp. MR2016-19]MBE5318264.1 hypothetical protein [Pedobacter sp. MR2016-19]
MSNPFPLKPTIGTIPESLIPGRESEISNLLRLLSSQSVSLEEMRRMGKSLLLIKLAYLCNNNNLPAEFADQEFKAKYFSFQGKQNLGEVIDMLMNSLKEFKEWYSIDFSKTYNFIRGIVASPSGEIGGVKFSVNLPKYKKSWKDIFFKALDEIAEVQEKHNSILILIFDELPIMLWDWYKKEQKQEAIELLDILRERRQQLESKGIRFVYCGSIGIKVVLNTLRNEFGYTGEPTNEMTEFDLKPFSKTESDFLIECFLLSKFKIRASAKSTIMTIVYQISNGIPFYISKIFNILQTQYDYEVSVQNIQKAYDSILNDPKEHTAFNQLLDRLTIYYTPDDAQNMKKILNIIAKANTRLNETEIHQKSDINDIEIVKKSVRTLFGDHYLSRTVEAGERKYDFKYSIYKTWWKINIA